ncbi:hypothetical protein SK128_011820, partial [Halocaridina rubra]
PAFPTSNKKEEQGNKQFPLTSLTTRFSQDNPNPPTPLTGQSIRENELEEIHENFYDINSVSPDLVPRSLPHEQTRNKLSPSKLLPHLEQNHLLHKI